MSFCRLAILTSLVSDAAAMVSLQLSRQDVPIIKNKVVVAHKTAFFGQVYAGRPQKPFTVVFDTGSGHVILPSSDCTSPTCMEKRRYSANASATARNVTSSGKPVSAGEAREQAVITFGTGQVKGQFVSDSVCLVQHSEISNSACVDVRIVTAVEMTEDPFNAFAFDGVLGLSLARLSLKPAFNFFGQMAEQSGADFQSQFALFLSSKPSVPSVITLGGYEPSRLAEPLQWVPVASPEHGYWQIKIKSVTVGSQRLALCEKGGCRAILDSGTSLLGVPRSELRSMHRMLARVLPEDHGEVDCRQWDGPPIVFDFGQFSMTFTAEDYSRMGPANMLVAGGGPGAKRDFCRASLLPVDLKEPLGPAAFVMGEPVLRKFYTVFDWGRKKVGFGLAKHADLASDKSSEGSAPGVGAVVV